MTGFTFDIRTAYMIGSLLYVVLPVVAWLVLTRHRSTAIILWCGGSLMFGIGFITLSMLRGHAPDALSYPLANLLIFSSFAIRIQSLRVHFGAAYGWRRLVATSLAFVTTFEILRHWTEMGRTYALFATACHAVMICLFALTAWRLGRRHDSAASQGVGAAYGLAGAASLWFLLSMAADVPGHTILSPAADVYALAICMIMAAIVGHLGFFGIVLEDAARRKTEAAARLAREEESRRLAVQLAQFDRQRGIAELSSSLAHELTQPLTAILSNAQTAKRGIKTKNLEEPQLMELLGRIEFNSRRANDIIKRIRAFIRPQLVNRKPVDLCSVTRETVALIGYDAPSRNVEVVVRVPKEPVWVVADAIQVSQVILNLCRNAVDAVSATPQTSRREIVVTIDVGNGRAVLSVQDSGPGLGEQAQTLAGTPFFTTKADGLGMGLAISRAITEQHGGKMSFRNAECCGAVFEISLPLMAPQPEGCQA